jgi:uncharacterized membrane-anchored protein YhcB (DUF1043 family)
MRIRVTLFALLISLALITAQYGLAATANQDNAVTTLAHVVPLAATTTPTPESSAEHDHDAPTAEDSTGQAMVVSEPGQVFQVAIATYLLDTAGFHVIDERLNQEGVIDPGDAGVVNRVNRVLGATSWPEDLQAQVDSLRATLDKYAEALANDDVEAAKPLATQAHELQHDLSHAVESWLGEMTAGTVAVGAQEQMFQVTIAAYLLDTAGFHAIDERLNQEGVIDPGDAGVVNRVNRVLGATSWPEDLQAQVDSLRATLDTYVEALANDDVEAAKPLATQAHELQHDLSHAVESWLGGGSGGVEHGAEGEHDHAEEQGEEHGG